MDIAVPGTDQVRSFSMANTSSRDGLLEFVIKVYPDGLFSQFLDQRLAVGDRLELTGPFGVFTLRESDAELVLVGGGAGMAPILSLLRSMAERGIHRKVTFFYGARGQRDLCFTGELHAIAEKLPNFTYIPALSHHDPDHGDWEGENGLITDVVKRLTGPLASAHAYVCGPPPMVEAAIPLLETLGVPEKRIYYDKFTTTGEPSD
jgi:propane monooxygenase reductase subunit